MSGDQERKKCDSLDLVSKQMLDISLNQSKLKQTCWARQAYSDSNINRRGLSSAVLSFHNAIRNNDLNKVNEYLESGINPNIQDVNTGRFPLLEATKLGYVNIVKALVNARVNINQSNIQGTTALHTCFSTNVFNREIAQVFLEQRKTDYDVQEKTTGNTPLHILSKISVSDNPNQKAIKDVLKEMVPHCQVNLQNKAGNTPLHIMVMGKRDDCEVIKNLMEANCDVNICNHFGETPLAAAINNGKFSMAMTILDFDVDTGIKDKCGHSLLHYAAKKNSLLIVRRLLDIGCDVNDKDSSGDTALHVSAGRGYTEVVTELLKHKNIRVNMQNENGYTPLMCAVDSNFIKVVELLMRFNCDTSVTSSQYNKGALDIAKENMRKRCRKEIYEMLLSYTR